MSHPAEAVCERYLEAWQRRDWKAAAKHTQQSWARFCRSNGRSAPDVLCRRLQFLKLVSYEVGEPEPVAKSEVMVDVPIDALIRPRGGRTKPELHTLRFRVIAETDASPDPDGTWGVNPISTMRGLTTP